VPVLSRLLEQEFTDFDHDSFLPISDFLLVFLGIVRVSAKAEGF
jgi:hypothetical protein